LKKCCSANATKSYDGKEFNKSCEHCGEKFMLLQEFAAGLFCIIGSSHTVESNYSILNKPKVIKECASATMPWKDNIVQTAQATSAFML
jgi:hypothetical protein